MSPITTHVLDMATGQPAEGLTVVLETKLAEWQELARKDTGPDGRIRDLLPEDAVVMPGLYRLCFDTSSRSPFFPEITILFQIDQTNRHYHVPLLLSPYGYTTYRGS